jgi:uncharacterized protein
MKQPDWESANHYILERLERELPPDLFYHSLQHTRDDVLPAAERLSHMSALSSDETLLVRTAALYHDIGFIEQYSQNEQIAVRIASETLPQFGYSPDQIQRIGAIILATQLPQNPTNLLEEIICDADLDSLGRDDFFTTSHRLRQELQARGNSLSLAEWYRIQLRFLHGHNYFTAAARALRQAGKQQNIEELKRRLENLATI